MMRFGIAAKLALLLLGFGFLSMGLVGTVAYTNSRTTVLESAQRELLTATQVLGRQFQTNMEIVSSDALMLSRLPSAPRVAQARLTQDHSADEAALVAAFEALMVVRPAYFQVRLISAAQHGLELVRVDRDGANLITVAAADMQEKSHNAYVFNTLALGAGQVYLSDISLNHEQGAHDGLDKPTLRVATPVTAADGSVLALVVINLDLNGLFERLKADLPNAYQVYLSNHWGDYLIHPNPAEAFGFDAGRRIFIQDAFKPVADLIKGTGGSAVTSVPPITQRSPGLVAAFVRLPYGAQRDEQRFVVLGLSQPMAQVVKQIEHLGWRTLQVMLAGGVGALLLAVLLARLVTQPLKRMTEAMQGFAEDQTVSLLNDNRQDEIGVLAASLNAMQNTLVSNLQELNASRDAIEQLAQHDPLTGLPNRALFQDRLVQAMTQAERDHGALALMFVDLDGFKPVNDLYGHQVGDELLNVVAQRLQDCVRRMDTVGRIGGDEFVVLLPLVSSVHDAVVVAEKICQSLHEAVNIEGHHVMISASVGVALYPHHAHDMKTLIHLADTAMYLAKKTGGNQMKVAVVANPDRAV